MDKLSVLIADDDTKTRQLLSTALSRRDYEVHEAKTGQEVVEFLEHQIPNLLILDLGMPLMNGPEVIGWVRMHDINVPIMVLTAYDRLDLKIRVLDAGADDYVTKPFILEEFLARLRALVRRSGESGLPKMGIEPDGLRDS